MKTISVVTPSLNGAKYLRRTIESVLSQNVDLEYIIVDGGSTDGTVDILNEYRSKARIIIERDRGQADAIAKGFSLAQGEILAWLNSDDMYLPDALAKVASIFERGGDFVFGHVLIVNAKDQVLRKRFAIPVAFPDLFYGSYVIPQESTFFSRKLYQRCGGIDPSFEYAMDYDLWLRMAKVRTPLLLDAFLACFRFHAEQKSRQVDRYVGEARMAREKLSERPQLSALQILKSKSSLAIRTIAANLYGAGLTKTIADGINKKRGRLP